MVYESIDALQNILSKTFFVRTKDAKKASGRALGTFVEIITYYLIKCWGFQNNLSIETKLPEYGFDKLTHNVEFTLHKLIDKKIDIDIDSHKNLSIKKIISNNNIREYDSFIESNSQNIIQKKDGITFIKNSAIIGTINNAIITSYVDTSNFTYKYVTLDKNPFAMFECKRVGKEGDSKGPQTIEKAKQGAYVAKSVSSLQKIIRSDGTMMGVYFDDAQNAHIDEYEFLLDKIINKNITNIDNFVLTVGVVSNHGNWFTSSNKNKELEVLGNSYDWLLFLTDQGLTKFAEDIFNIDECKNAFSYSYSINPHTGKKNDNIFTKSYMEYNADRAITEYFNKNIGYIEAWFTVLNKDKGKLSDLRQQLNLLSS